LKQLVPGISVAGIDVSEYGISEAPGDVRGDLVVGNAAQLPFRDQHFDFVFSINTLHNLYCYELYDALREIERVGRSNKYVCVESYRNEDEKANLLYWQLTCESFCTPTEWEWWFKHSGYTGDHSFIFFE
jgi:protein-L-isoaspartate(D-aspartate) O-methyltransferase